MTINESVEDYLEAILVLKEKNGMVRSIDVVHHMNYSKPSISRAMSRLRENGYITMDPEGWLGLTDARAGDRRAHLRAPPPAHRVADRSGRGPRGGPGGRLPHGARHQRRDLRLHPGPYSPERSEAELKKGRAGEKRFDSQGQMWYLIHIG